MRTRLATPGQDDVDMAIRVLMKAGAYNPELRRAYEEGEDITAAGTREAWNRQEFGVRNWVQDWKFVVEDECFGGPPPFRGHLNLNLEIQKPVT